MMRIRFNHVVSLFTTYILFFSRTIVQHMLRFLHQLHMYGYSLHCQIINFSRALQLVVDPIFIKIFYFQVLILATYYAAQLGIALSVVDSRTEYKLSCLKNSEKPSSDVQHICNELS